MPKMQVTEFEAAFLQMERERLALDSRDWAAEPFISDLQIAKMSPGAVQWKVMVNIGEYWLRDECHMIYRNIRHPDNQVWYMEHLMTRVARGELMAYEVHAELAKLPVYSKQEPTQE